MFLAIWEFNEFYLVDDSVNIVMEKDKCSFGFYINFILV